jgi:hypothetical protein
MSKVPKRRCRDPYRIDFNRGTSGEMSLVFTQKSLLNQWAKLETALSAVIARPGLECDTFSLAYLPRSARLFFGRSDIAEQTQQVGLDNKLDKHLCSSRGLTA